MDTGINSGINGQVKSPGLATTETHVGNTALEALALAILSSFNLLGMSLSGPLDAHDNIRHGTRAI